MSLKKIVKEFYKQEALIHPELLETFLHSEFTFEWISASGYIKMNKQELIDYSKKLSQSYQRFVVKNSFMIKDKDSVCIRGEFHAKIIENISEMVYISNFMAMCEVKDDKIISLHQISQKA